MYLPTCIRYHSNQRITSPRKPEEVILKLQTLCTCMNLVHINFANIDQDHGAPWPRMNTLAVVFQSGSERCLNDLKHGKLPKSVNNMISNLQCLVAKRCFFQHP